MDDVPNFDRLFGELSAALASYPSGWAPEIVAEIEAMQEAEELPPGGSSSTDNSSRICSNEVPRASHPVRTGPKCWACF